jgi:diguanylate cyclase (GGDEF)-like protein
MWKPLIARSAGDSRGGRLAAGVPSDTRVPFWRTPITWLVACGALLIACVVIGTMVMVGHFRERALKSGERELSNTVMLLAHHFDQQFEEIQTAEKDVIAYMQAIGISTPEAFRRQASSEDMHRLLQARVNGLLDVASFSMFDSDGYMLNASDIWPVPPLSIADRDYFKTLERTTTPVVIELVHNRISGRPMTVIARRISAPNGDFLGVVVRSLMPAAFERFFASVTLGENSSISLFHSDGTMLARYPHTDAMIGWNFAKAPLMRLAHANGSGTLRLKSPIDGKDRLGAVETLKGVPLAVVATTTVAASLADWHAQTRFMIIAAGLAVLVIAAMLALIVRKMARQHRAARQRLALEKQRLDTALNNMKHALLLFGADMRMIVCNQRYLDMFNVLPEVAKPGCTLRRLVEHRKERGSLPGSVDDYYDNFLRRVRDEVATQWVTKIADGRSIEFQFQPLAQGGWVTTMEDITERLRAEEKIVHLAHYDALTELPNRVMFREYLEREFDRIDAGAQFAVLYIDIDEFKSINDSLGHPVGDELLKVIASRLRDCIGDGDIVARLGGDEFAVMQTAAASRDDVAKLVTRIQGAIRIPCDCLGHHIATDASIGIALAPLHGADLDQLLKHADLAMYAAKADGRRTYRFFEPEMDARVKARQRMEQELRRIIATDSFSESGFEIHYQPLVDLHSRRVTGCEALLRWRHAEHGLISPVEFIPVAEETGLITALGEWVLSTACMEAVNWPGDVRLAVNVSPVQFRSQTLALSVATALSNSGLAPHRLELEITEAVLIRDDDTARTILLQLRGLGVRTALDDFGTGYSSLSYLQRFPFDKIKIDRSFVNAIADDEGSLPIVQAVVTIAASRNMTTVAEGVETDEQRDLLRALGCTEMQGYLFSAAKPAADIRRLLTGGADKPAVVAA